MLRAYYVRRGGTVLKLARHKRAMKGLTLLQSAVGDCPDNAYSAGVHLGGGVWVPAFVAVGQYSCIASGTVNGGHFLFFRKRKGAALRRRLAGHGAPARLVHRGGPLSDSAEGGYRGQQETLSSKRAVD